MGKDDTEHGRVVIYILFLNDTDDILQAYSAQSNTNMTNFGLIQTASTYAMSYRFLIVAETSDQTCQKSKWIYYYNKVSISRNQC